MLIVIGKSKCCCPRQVKQWRESREKQSKYKREAEKAMINGRDMKVQ